MFKKIFLGVFPNTLKVAKITPIYESRTKTNRGKYRPISALSVLPNILEKLYTQFQKFFHSPTKVLLLLWILTQNIVLFISL